MATILLYYCMVHDGILYNTTRRVFLDVAKSTATVRTQYTKDGGQGMPAKKRGRSGGGGGGRGRGRGAAPKRKVLYSNIQ